MTKLGLVTRAYHDFDTHLNFTSDLTESLERISIIMSPGKLHAIELARQFDIRKKFVFVAPFFGLERRKEQREMVRIKWFNLWGSK